MRAILFVCFCIAVTSAHSIEEGNFGGHIEGGCYRGDGYRVDVVCATRDLEAEVSENDRTFRLKTHLEAVYKDKRGEKVDVTAKFHLSDIENFYQPESQLPILVRFIVRESQHKSARSIPVILKRVPGKRELEGTTVQSFYNDFGAKRARIVQKMEILLPGVSKWVIYEGISPAR